ncbi:MAG: alpha/beta hydrolase-fold protein, partial [Bacteroidota bacterium]
NTERRHSEYFPQKPFASLPQAYRDSLFQATFDPENGLFRTEICSDDYLRFLTQELKPFIDQEFSTLPDKENTFVAGSSMGGLISMYALCEYPEVFGGAGCLSTHWVGIFDTLNNPIPQHFVSYLEANLPSPEDHRLYFDYGTATLDALYEPYQQMVDTVMVAKGYTAANWTTKKFPGAPHTENAWRERLEVPLVFLLGE